MFELEGTQFDLSQMQIWAQEAGLSVQDYADKYGFKKVGKQTPETNPAIVEGETMELPQADSLLESELQAKEPKYKIKDGGYYSKTELVEEYPELADDNAFQRYANKYFERDEDGQAKAIGPMAGEQLKEVVVSKEIDRFKEEKKQAEEVDNKEAEELFANDYTSTEMYYPPVAGAKGVEVEKESNKIRKQFLAANENDLSKAKEAYLESKKEGRLASIIEQKLLTSEDEELKQFGETLAKTGQKIEKEDIVLEAFKERKLSKLLSNSTAEANRIVSQSFQTQEEVDAAKEDLKYQGAVQGAIIKKYNEVHNNINEKLKGLQDEQEILDVVKRDYDPLSIVAANLAAFSAETTSSLIALPQWLTKTRDQVIKDVTGTDREDLPLWAQYLTSTPLEQITNSEGVKAFQEDLKKSAEEQRSSVARPQSIEDISNAGQFGTFMADLVGNQTGQFALMMVAPQSSLGILSASAAGSKFEQMNAEMAEGKDYSAWQLFAAPTVAGMAEYLTEKITLGQAKTARAALFGSSNAMEAAQLYFKQNWSDLLLKNPSKEAFGESVAQALGENANNYYILGDKSVNLMDGVPTAAASGFLMSATMYNSPLIGKKLMKDLGIMRSNDNAEITRIQELKNDLDAELKKLDAKSPEAEAINETVQRLTTEQNKILFKTIDNMDKLTDADKDVLINISKELTGIQQEMQKLGELNLSKTARKAKEDELAKRYNEANQVKEQILNVVNDEAFDYESFELRLLDEAGAKGLTQNQYITQRVDILSKEIEALEVQMDNTDNPKAKQAIQRKINVRRDQVSNAIPNALGIQADTGGTIESANTLVEASKAFVARSKELLTQMQEGNISQDVYNKGYKALQNKYNAKRNSFATGKKEFTKLQDIYDKYNIKKGETIPTAATNEIIKATGGIVESITRRLYDRAPDEAKKGYGRNDFKNDVTSEIFELIQNEFDPSIQTLDKFISNRESLRAQRLVKKQMKQVFEADIDGGGSAIDSAMREELTIDDANEKIDSAKALGLEFDEADVVKELLKNYNPDTKSFKRDISGGFITKFKDKAYEFMGKDTKTNKAFTEKLKSNPSAFYDVLSVEGMRMARGKNKTNPFEEAGMLIEKNGVLEKVAFENINQQDFIDYFTDPSLATQARSNRQNRFKDAVAVSIASAQAIKALNTNEELRTKITDLNQLKQDVAGNLGAPGDLSEFTDVLKNLAKAKDINAAAKQLSITGKITINLSNLVEKQNEMLEVIKEAKIPSIIFEAAKFANFGAEYRPGRIVDGKFVLDTTSKNKYFILSKPIDGKMFLPYPSSQSKKSELYKKYPGYFLPKKDKGSLYYNQTDPAYIKAREEAKKNDKNYPNLKKPGRVTSNFFSSNANVKYKNNMDALETMATILGTAVADGTMSPQMAALFISQSYQGTGGLIKIAAGFKYKSKKFEFGIKKFFQKGPKDVPYREEHNPPASVVGASLLWAITNNKVEAIMPYIRKNYYQTQLSKRDDERLDAADLGAKLPEGFSILDDSSVRLAKAGIDLNTIVNMETGKTMAQEQKVQSQSTPDAVKASNDALIEKTDKVEFVIDRAIGKLTELTGTKGLAVDPFLLLAAKDVSLNVLIGGLRAVKVAYKGGKSLAKAIDAGYQSVSKYMSEAEWLEFAKVATGEGGNTPAQVRLSIYNEAGVVKLQETVRNNSEQLLNDLGIETLGLSTDEINAKLDVLRKAKIVAMNTKAPKKKARVFDFDDTLATSKSNVLYTLPDGTEGKLTATEFAAQSEQLQEAGAEFDFSEFSKVVDGQKGPLAQLAKKLVEAKGERDVFVLTARPANSAQSIQSFLRSALGISIPLENITGLGDGTPSAKAFWMAEKVSEGYNDMFFADDAKANVAAVNDMLERLGVKKKTQVAKETEAPALDDAMDNILRRKGSSRDSFFKKYNIYVPAGADDFVGLLYTFLGKGKEGEQTLKFFEDNLLKPFAEGISAYESAKVNLAKDYKALSKRYNNKKLLKEKIIDGVYTNEQAVRAYLYDKAGYDLDINKADASELIATVEGNSELRAFAEDLAKITKIPEGYPAITVDWLGGNIQTDLANVSNKGHRDMFLQEWKNNKNQIFSPENMKLIFQLHGNDFTDALKNILERMETGVNRKKGKDKEFNQAMNWLNASVANIMSFNTRSAILQQLSAINFMNWSFNNPFMMAKAMANVPQFAKDFNALFNSDFLLERRGGMKIEINTADLANTEPGNWFTKTHKKLLEVGFMPTQWGDSFAISFGGASWYRNNINRLVKQGMTEQQAIEQTMQEFQEIAEETQQSSRPDRISRQQASDIGRLILAFANTPLQYARLTKKAALDLVNRRGDWKTNASKLVYYGVAQNILFSTLQSALFSMLFDDEVEEKEEKKLMYAANGILDGTLRGMGYQGAVIAALKNLGMEYYRQKQIKDQGGRVQGGDLRLIQQGLTISPPISKKIGDIVEAQRYETWRQYKYSPFYQNYAIANYVSGIFNIPADRVFKKLENINAMSLEYNDAWQNILLGLGWSPYSVDVDLVDLRSKRNEEGTTTPLDKVQENSALPDGVLGKAHKDGTIELAPGLSPAKKKKVVAHEKKHLHDMKTGKLNYDANSITWNGKKYQRLQGKKVLFNGKALPEGDKRFPWEKSANKATT